MGVQIHVFFCKVSTIFRLCQPHLNRPLDCDVVILYYKLILGIKKKKILHIWFRKSALGLMKSCSHYIIVALLVSSLRKSLFLSSC